MRCGSKLVLLALIPFVPSCVGVDVSSRDGEMFMRLGKSPNDSDYECVLRQVGIDRSDIIFQAKNPFVKNKKGRVLMYKRIDDRVRFKYAPPCGDMEGWRPSGNSGEGMVNMGFSYNW